MRLRRRQPGDYSGLALYTIEGLWVVSVSQYTGWNNKDGYVWRSIPAEGFFRLDVLTRQVAAARLPFTVELRGDRCLFKPTRTSGRVGPDGALIKRFMNRFYSTFGQQQRPVDWSWEIRQYG
jgi:hypothetical protein